MLTSLAPLQAAVPRAKCCPGVAPGARPGIAASIVSMDIISCRVPWLRSSDFGNKALTQRGISVGKHALQRLQLTPAKGQGSQEGAWDVLA